MKRSSKFIKVDRETILQAKNLNDAEARFLVSNYYLGQKLRKRADSQVRSMSEGAPEDLPFLLSGFGNYYAEIEALSKRALDTYARNHLVGIWMLRQVGIGPVIAAGILAHVDITKAPTAGHIWSFAGLNPDMKWNKGEKRPFNPELKQIAWHAGQCFMKTYNDPDSFYGPLYRGRKDLVVARNESGQYAERAKHYHTTSQEVKRTLKLGKLPASNLDAQARRFTVKIFLSHVHALMYWEKFEQAPPKPFGIAILGHAHEIKVPYADDLFPGFAEAYYSKTP